MSDQERIDYLEADNWAGDITEINRGCHKTISLDKQFRYYLVSGSNINIIVPPSSMLRPKKIKLNWPLSGDLLMRSTTTCDLHLSLTMPVTSCNSFLTLLWPCNHSQSDHDFTRTSHNPLTISVQTSWLSSNHLWLCYNSPDLSNLSWHHRLSHQQHCVSHNIADHFAAYQNLVGSSWGVLIALWGWLSLTMPSDHCSNHQMHWT